MRQRPQARAQIGNAELLLAGRRARRQQHRKFALAGAIEQVEEGLFVGDAAIEVFDDEAGAVGEGGDGGVIERRRRDDAGPRAQAPHVGEMAFARALRPDDDASGMRPIGPAVDQSRRPPALELADEEVLGPQRLAVREIEDELARSCGHCRR